MPPRKSSSTVPATLKQGKLSFSAKRNSSFTATGKQSKPATKKSISRTSSSPTAEPIDISSDSENDRSFDDEPIVPAQKKRRLNPARSAAAQKAEKPETAAEPEPQREKLNLSDKRWRKQFGIAHGKMGNIEPVHAQGQSMVHHILRVFDLSYEYGPCVGISRLDRWERAEALGLNPPPEVKEILMTQEGSTDEQFSQSVFHGEV
ncbi:hypothetical protein BV20DRAFT_974151 [Pilatotrama ljubarskyi]|nr:hypothetical protein BV20DRAFT_974151 [Pilatotrama ljubarskyi]